MNNLEQEIESLVLETISEVDMEQMVKEALEETLKDLNG